LETPSVFVIDMFSCKLLCPSKRVAKITIVPYFTCVPYKGDVGAGWAAGGLLIKTLLA
jgi:hypothetical protein